jgi:hypothetical protein
MYYVQKNIFTLNLEHGNFTHTHRYIRAPVICYKREQGDGRTEIGIRYMYTCEPINPFGPK